MITRRLLGLGNPLGLATKRVHCKLHSGSAAGKQPRADNTIDKLSNEHNALNSEYVYVEFVNPLHSILDLQQPEHSHLEFNFNTINEAYNK